jgi:hypothetical protein
LTITGTNNGIVSFAVTANTTGSNRVAHINLFNRSIAVTQGVFITPPVLDWSLSSSNTLQFTFTNNQTTAFTVLTTTNLSLPLSDWTSLGAPVSIAPGIFQFTSPVANDPTRFYSVRSP